MALKWKSAAEKSPYCHGSSEFIQQPTGNWIERKPDGTTFVFRCERIQGDNVVLIKSDGARIEITGTECRINGHLFYTGNFVEPGADAGGHMQGGACMRVDEGNEVQLQTSQSCAVCLEENLPMNALVPCGHVFCTTCSTHVATCPTCRSKKTGTIRLFFN